MNVSIVDGFAADRAKGNRERIAGGWQFFSGRLEYRRRQLVCNIFFVGSGHADGQGVCERRPRDVEWSRNSYSINDTQRMMDRFSIQSMILNAYGAAMMDAGVLCAASTRVAGVRHLA